MVDDGIGDVAGVGSGVFQFGGLCFQPFRIAGEHDHVVSTTIEQPCRL
jgi:hypothetical protein